MRKNRAVISSEPLNVSVPRSWGELTVTQFKAVCNMFADVIYADSFDAILFLYLSGINYVGKNEQGKVLVRHEGILYVVNEYAFAAAPDHIKWVHEVAQLKDLEKLVKAVHKSAIDLRMESLSLAQFLSADSVYSGYVATHKPDLADRLVRFLYPKIRKIKPWYRPAAVIWFSALKNYLMHRFPDLYAEPDRSDIFSSVNASPSAVREQIDAMVRALTKGDVTMEERVLAVPVYRALSELNQLAKEYKDLKKL